MSARSGRRRRGSARISLASTNRAASGTCSAGLPRSACPVHFGRPPRYDSVPASRPGRTHRAAAATPRAWSCDCHARPRYQRRTRGARQIQEWSARIPRKVQLKNATAPRAAGLLHTVCSGDPDGGRSRDRHLHRLITTCPIELRGRPPRLASQQGSLLSLRAASPRHEAVQPAPLRRSRINYQAGRGRSLALTPSEITNAAARNRAGESVRSIGRAYGVSHETIRRMLASTSTQARR